MAAHGTVIELDQAIFTSAESIMSQGYRVVAHTPRITAEEKKTIATSSPSHGSLCDKSDDAAGISFYPLPTGRYCVARSCYAGQEQTGRGGRRVLTHVFVLDDGQMSAFTWNPLSVLRALQERQAFELPDRLPDTLETVAVAPCTGNGAQAVAAAMSDLGDQPFLCLLSELIGDACVIVAGLDLATTTTEGLLMAAPRGLRARFDFSVGLRFAIGRRHRLNWVEADPRSTKRIIRGQKFRLLERLHEGRVPPFKMVPWSEMVADCRQTSSIEELARLTDEEFDDDSPELLERVAGRQIELNHVRERSIDALFQTLLSKVDTEATRVEQRLDQRYRATARDCLVSRLTALPREEAVGYCPALASLAETDPTFEQLKQALAEGSEAAADTARGASNCGDCVIITDRPS